MCSPSITRFQDGIGGQTEFGGGLGHDIQRTWPADILVPNWVLGNLQLLPSPLAFADLCHSARLGVKVEVGSRLKPGLRQYHPADILVADWERGRPAAGNITVTSPLTPAF